MLKNALDSLWVSNAFRNKPIATVAYSAGGIRAIEHLVQVAIETEAIPLRNTALIPFTNDAFDAAGRPTSLVIRASLEIMLDALGHGGRPHSTGPALLASCPKLARLRAAIIAATETEMPDRIALRARPSIVGPVAPTVIKEETMSGTTEDQPPQPFCVMVHGYARADKIDAARASWRKSPTPRARTRTAWSSASFKTLG